MKMTLKEIDKHVNQEEGSLNLSSSAISLDQMTMISDFLNRNPDIKTLILETNKLGDKCAIALAAIVTITKLIVNHNDIGDEGAMALAANNTLTSLFVSDNSISDKGAKALASNSSIKSLNINGNLIGENGAMALAANNTITRLDIGHNCIGVDGAIALAKNTHIRSLHVWRIFIESADEIAFVNALKKNNNLVFLFHNFRQHSVKSSIKKILGRNRVMPWLLTVKHARLMAQAQRSKNCPFGKIPRELAAVINNYAIGFNLFTFFNDQFDKRPTSKDLVTVKNMGGEFHKLQQI